MSGSEEKAKRKQWQFSLRELVGITLIVALAFGYWQERVHRQNAANRLEKLLSMPHICVQAPNGQYRAPATFAVMGNVFLPMNMVKLENPRVAIQLVRAENLEVVTEIDPETFFDAASGRYTFITEFKRSKNVSLGLHPGTYLLRAKCFDGNIEVATGLSVLEVVK